MSRDRVSDTLIAMRAKGVKIWAENGQLRYKTSQQSLAAEDLHNLRSLKHEILAFLQEHPRTRSEPRPRPRQPGARVPLSFPQQYLWKINRLDERASQRTVATALRLDGQLNIPALQRSLAALIQCHEALRTRFIALDELAEQHVESPSAPSLEIFKLSSSCPSAWDTEAMQLAAQLAHESVSVTQGPLFAVRLIELERFCHVLAIATDHLISDAASLSILRRELLVTYSRAVSGQRLPSASGLQYPDYAVWQQATHGSWTQAHRSYWTQQLATARRLQLLERPDIAATTASQWHTLPIKFGPTLSTDLREVGRLGRTTLVMTVLTAFVALLSRWCNVTDLVIPFVTDGRADQEFINTIGFFGGPIFLRIALAEEDTFSALLQRITAVYATAQERDRSCRVAALMCESECIRNPVFNWIPQESNTVNRQQVTGNLSSTGFELDPAPRNDQEWDAEPRLDLADLPDGIQGVIAYPAHRIAVTTIERFRDQLLHFAQKLAARPELRINTLTSHLAVGQRLI